MSLLHTVSTTEVFELTDPRLQPGGDLHRQWVAAFASDPLARPLQHPDHILAEADYPRAHTKPGKHWVIWDREDGETTAIAVLLPKSMNAQRIAGMGPDWQLHGWRLASGRCLQPRGVTYGLQRTLDRAVELITAAEGDFLLIEELDVRSDLYRSLSHLQGSSCLRFQPHAFQSRLRIRLPETAAEYWETQFSARTWQNIRRKLSRCESPRLELFTRADQVDEFLAGARDVSLETWQSRRYGLRMQNDQYEQKTLRALAELGMLRCALWFDGGRPIAFAVGNQHHGRFHLEEIGYRTEAAKRSPGQLMLVSLIEELYRFHTETEGPPRVLDFGGGDSEYKRQFANDLSSSGSVWLVPKTWKARSILTWLITARTAGDALRTAATGFGQASALRQWIRTGIHGLRPDAGESSGDLPALNEQEVADRHRQLSADVGRVLRKE